MQQAELQAPCRRSRRCDVVGVNLRQRTVAAAMVNRPPSWPARAALAALALSNTSAASRLFLSFVRVARSANAQRQLKRARMEARAGILALRPPSSSDKVAEG